MEADFSGYATKAGLKCSDGRTIMPDAFKHQDRVTVPLVWQHGHDTPENILGHAILENRSDGVYSYGFFNDTKQGQNAKKLVIHKDVTALSIYANQLVEKAKQVLHGSIREVSLVLSGANPGALIDFVRVAHSDGEVETLDDEAIIYTGLTLEHEDLAASHAATSTSAGPPQGKTVKEVYDSLDEEQKNVVHYMIGQALASNTAAHSDDSSSDDTSDDDTSDDDKSDDDKSDDDKSDDKSDDDKSDNKDEGDLNHKEGTEDMTRNVFEQAGAGNKASKTLTHAQISTIVEDAQKMGSFKEAVLAHAVEYGIENIDYLFPDPKTLSNTPELISRRQEWVATFWNALNKNPFSRIKTMSADITQDEARAKGYIKGTLKKNEWFTLNKRVTTPTTVYKKQKLDRDDIVDITDLDVVAWLKAEMRLMLDEEIARAALVGDGREVDDEDKINETNIRPIAFDDDFYAHKVTVANNVVGDGLVDAVLTNRKYYRGLGNPVMFTTEDVLSEMLLAKDDNLRRLYNSVTDLATALRVRDIVTVPVMESVQTNTGQLIAIQVNPSDYTVGADRGGAVSMFDDFDIDYNQYKYLIETRCSGALTKFKTALVISRADSAGDTLATPTAPTFVSGTGVVTIPTVTGVVYKNADTGATLTAGAQTALAAGATLNVDADPASGYVFPHGTDEDWSFTRPLA